MVAFDFPHIMRVYRKEGDMKPPYTNLASTEILTAKCMVQVPSNSKIVDSLVSCDYMIYCEYIQDGVIQRGDDIQIMGNREIRGKIKQFSSYDTGLDTSGVRVGTTIWVNEIG